MFITFEMNRELDLMEFYNYFFNRYKLSEKKVEQITIQWIEKELFNFCTIMCYGYDYRELYDNVKNNDLQYIYNKRNEYYKKWHNKNK